MTDRSTTSAYSWRRVLRVCGFLVLLAVVALFVAVAFPTAVGADHSFVVKSSSMSPAIDAGSVVFVTEIPADTVSEGDVVTFERASGGASERVTHRVVDVLERDGDPAFRTKGDANENQDSEIVNENQLVGLVEFHIPLLGYGVALAGSQVGIVAFVIVPALLLIVSELWELYRVLDSESE